MLTNPIKQARLANSLTQRQLASLCNVTRDAVLKTEKGLYGSVPPRILAPVAALLGCSENSLEKAYREFQRETRYENRGVLLRVIANGAEFKGERYVDFRRRVGPVAGFCKLLCINPSQWDRLENKGGADSFFRTALRDGELEWLANSLYL